MRKIPLIPLLFALILLDTCCITACSMSPSQRDSLLQQADALQANTATERARQAAELAAATAAGDTDRIKRAQKAIDLLDKVSAMTQQGHDVLAVSTNPDDTFNVSPAAGLLGGLVGGPIGSGLVIGLPLLFGAIQTWRKSQADKEAAANLAAGEAALASVAKGLDKVSIADPALSKALDAAWSGPSGVESMLTPMAKDVINEHSVT